MFGIEFARLDAAAALDRIEQLAQADPPVFVVHANVHTVNLAHADASYRAVLQRADLVLNDGKGVMMGAAILGTPFPQDVNGNFFTPLLLARAAERGWSVFFYGAKPGVAERAAEGLRRDLPRLNIVGVRDGFTPPGQEEELLQAIRDSGAALLLVGLGNPRQELWLDRYLDKTGVRIGSGVGAFFDFQAGAIRRAPDWMNRFGMEWVYRLLLEPGRLWHRYVVGNPAFLWRVVRERLAARGAGR
jgi:N-acetylglucosaminyldiphosphoundecaprenol N-acetyl-beta-D-mannosaminyltransferase